MSYIEINFETDSIHVQLALWTTSITFYFSRDHSTSPPSSGSVWRAYSY